MDIATVLHLTNGREIGRLLDQVIAQAANYRRVVVCSPFIDECGLQLIDRLYAATLRSGTRVDVVSTPIMVAACEDRWRSRREFQLHSCPGLHAKLYVAMGFRPADHIAIVTSANLTHAGITQNVECGVRISGSTRTLSKLIERIPARLGHHTSLVREIQ